MTHPPRAVAKCLPILGLLLAPPLLMSQTITTSVQALDSDMLPLPGAKITARDAGTGRESSCITGTDGRCNLSRPGEGNTLLRGMAGLLEGTASLPVGAREFKLALRPALVASSITVVSGSRQEELQDESPIKVEAITRERMDSTGYERVSDHLQEIPGVMVRRGSTSTVGGEQIQGVDSRQVLVLQDGLPVLGARGIKSGAVNLNRQSSGRLTRIEVAKGSASSIYGSDAMGGVINMITKEPREALEGSLLLSGGSLGALDARGDIGGRFERGYFFVNLGVNRLDSYTLLPNSPTTVGPALDREDGLVKLRYQFVPNFSLGFTANAYRNREEGRNAGETGLVNGLNRDSTQSYALLADWILNSTATLQARAYAARYDENSLTTPIGRPGDPAPANLNERLARLDATLSMQLGSTHFLQGGAEWAQNLYRGVNRLVGDNVGQQITARDFWLQDKWTLHPRLTLTVGGRITEHSRFGAAAVPKAGIVYKLTDSLILRGSFGMGFRAPDLGQLYFRFANPANFYQVIGNPNLNPEHSQSFQAGAVFRRSRYRAGVTLFRNNIRDLIDSRLVGTPRSAGELNTILETYSIPPFFQPLLNRQTFVYANQARIYTEGVELDGEFSISRQLRAAGSYTFLNARDKVTRLSLTQRHPHNGTLRFDYDPRKFGLTANVRGTFYSHWLLNASTGTRGMAYQIWDAYVNKRWPHRVETFLAADNFNDSRDSKLRLNPATFDRPDYGRTFRAGLRYRFGGKE